LFYAASPLFYYRFVDAMNMRVGADIAPRQRRFYDIDARRNRHV